MTESQEGWPDLSKAEVRQMLKTVRQKAGIRPKRQTLKEARQSGFVAGYKAALKELVVLMEGSENQNV